MAISYRKSGGIAFCILTFFAFPVSVRAQVTLQTAGIRIEAKIDENTTLFDKETGQRVSYQEYQQRMKTDPYAYHLEPIYDEYGKSDSYTIRPTTADEKATHRFYNRDIDQRPKVGDTVPLFVMTDSDGKTYRSTDLKGQVVVLSLWLTLSRPFFDEKRMSKLSDLLKPYQSKANVLSLGTLSSSQVEVRDFLTTHTLPFVPVPDAYGFNKKFQALTFPTYIVIDRAGKVAAYLEGDADNELKSVLDTITR